MRSRHPLANRVPGGRNEIVVRGIVGAVGRERAHLASVELWPPPPPNAPGTYDGAQTSKGAFTVRGPRA
jgi:hypothetical protein